MHRPTAPKTKSLRKKFEPIVEARSGPATGSRFSTAGAVRSARSNVIQVMIIGRFGYGTSGSMMYLLRTARR
jgi:hypothetical protein